MSKAAKAGPKRSAGILLYRRKPAREVFLVHPGGPFFAKKDLGHWSIPKGEYLIEEPALEAAKREFLEETGFGSVLQGECAPLGEVKQKNGKIVTAFALEGDCDPAQMKSNTFLFEWPPHSRKMIEIPECDRGGWFSLEEASEKLNAAQAAFIDRLRERLA